MSPLPNDDVETLLTRDLHLWDALRGNRLFVTGGTGFLGLWLMSAVQAANRHLDTRIEAVLLSRNPEAFARRAPWLTKDPALSLWRGDVRDFSPPEGHFDRLIHAASETTTTAAEQPFHLVEAMVQGTWRVLCFARQRRVRQLLYVSSGAVYGEQHAGLERIPEDYPGAPRVDADGAAYGLGKRVAEHLCLQEGAASGLAVKIARCFTLVGPGMPLDAHFAIGNFIADALDGRAITVRGDGSPVRSYLYAADLVSWLLTILVEGKAGRSYNVGSDVPVTIAELADTVGEALGSGLPARVLSRESETSRRRYLPAIDRARRELGLDVWTPLEEAIRRTAGWVRGTRPG